MILISDKPESTFFEANEQTCSEYATGAPKFRCLSVPIGACSYSKDNLFADLLLSASNRSQTSLTRAFKAAISPEFSIT
jgi:hypothetical protein